MLHRFTLIILASLPVLAFAQTPPTQPLTGPGGSEYNHSDVTMYNYASQPDGFFIFEPASPVPDSANLVVFIHGLDIVNPYLYGGWITHLVRKGNIVIYPKYQDAGGNEPQINFNANTVTAIQNALDTLQLPGHVKPRLQNFVVAGHSYGGLMTANMGILADSAGLPSPKALMVCQAYYDNTFEVRLHDYSIMHADINLLIIVGDNDLIVGQTFGRFLMDSTVNVSTDHKNYIIHHTDNHGSPGLGGTHFEPCSKDNNYDTGESNLFTVACDLGTKTDAVDYYVYWKLLDALMDCSFYGTNCEYAFGDTPEQHGMGNWSDGQPVIPMTVEPAVDAGISGRENIKPVKIYPNPGSGNYLLDFPSEKDLELSIIVRDELGKTVLEKKEYLFQGRNQIPLNMTGLSNGTYAVQLFSHDGTWFSELVKY